MVNAARVWEMEQEIMEKRTIPIFFTVDEGYAPYLDCALRSLIRNASDAYDYQIYILYDKLTDESIRRLGTAVTSLPHAEIHFIRMEEEYAGLTDRTENRLRCDYFTMTIFFRIFIADMFPQYDKGIYIDSDVIVPGDISQMYELELGDCIIGACPDHSIWGIPELERYLEYSIGVEPHKYINSGVLLLNMKELRQVGFANRFLELLNKFHFDCVAPDQDYFNAMCADWILFLDECWDTMPPEGDNCKSVEEPKLIHFNLFQKPWCYDNIPYEEYFWEYAKTSPFYEDILAHKRNYSQEQKDSDRECLQTLITKGGRMDQQEITFRKMRLKGEHIRIADEEKGINQL